MKPNILNKKTLTFISALFVLLFTFIFNNLDMDNRSNLAQVPGSGFPSLTYTSATVEYAGADLIFNFTIQNVGDTDTEAGIEVCTTVVNLDDIDNPVVSDCYDYGNVSAGGTLSETILFDVPPLPDGDYSLQSSTNSYGPSDDNSETVNFSISDGFTEGGSGGGSGGGGSTEANLKASYIKAGIMDGDTFIETSELTQDQTLIIQYGIENSGDEDIDDWSYNISQSMVPFDGYDNNVRTGPSLNDGDEYENTIAFEDLPVGENAFKVDADYNNRIDETRESDNYDEVIVVVRERETVSSEDIALTDASFGYVDKGNFIANNTIRPDQNNLAVKFTVENMGYVTATKPSLSYVLRQQPSGLGVRDGFEYYGVLEVGESMTEEYIFLSGTLKPGKYSIDLSVDDMDSTNYDYNLENNDLTLEFEVDQEDDPEYGKVDLEVNNLSVGIMVGEDFKDVATTSNHYKIAFRFEVENIGSSDIDRMWSSKIQIINKEDSSIVYEGQMPGVSSIISGEIESFAFVHPPLTAGEYTIVVSIDTEDEIDEANESNNSISEVFVAKGCMSDGDDDKTLNDPSLESTFDDIRELSWQMSLEWLDTRIRPKKKKLAIYLSDQEVDKKGNPINRFNQEVLNTMLNTVANYYLGHCESAEKINARFLPLIAEGIETADTELGWKRHFLWVKSINSLKEMLSREEIEKGNITRLIQLIIFDLNERGILDNGITKGGDWESLPLEEKIELLDSLEIDLQNERARKLNPYWEDSYTWEEIKTLIIGILREKVKEKD